MPISLNNSFSINALISAFAFSIVHIAADHPFKPDDEDPINAFTTKLIDRHND